MLNLDSEDIIDDLLNNLNKPKRKTAGQDKSKNYHKITVSVDENMRADIIKLAEAQGTSISQFIKNLVIKEKELQ